MILRIVFDVWIINLSEGGGKMSAVVYTIERCVYDVVRIADRDAPSFKDKAIQLIQSKGYDKILSEYRDASEKEGGLF